jgi:hypothetical protein
VIGGCVRRVVVDSFDGVEPKILGVEPRGCHARIIVFCCH